jgi:hypothetical protein
MYYTTALPSNAQLLKLVSSQQVLRILKVFSYYEDATSLQVLQLNFKNFYIRSFKSYTNIIQVTF